MKFRFSHKSLTRLLAIHMMVFVLGASFPLGAIADTIVTVDIKANDLNGPITITDGDSYSYSWTSTNSTSCQITSPANSGIPLSGSDTVLPGSPFYPAIGAPMILTVVCTDGITTATDAVTINLASLPPPPPPAPTVDIKANDLNGPITITDGDSYSYSWTSTNSTSCQITSPANSGIPLSGSDTVLPGSPFYPAIGAPMILTVVCTDGITTATDAVTINLAGSLPPPPPPATSTPVTVTLTPNPASVLANATSTLTWSSTGATSCSAPWTALTTTSGTQIVTVANTTTYSITCTNGTNSDTANATVTVTSLPPPPAATGKITFCIVLADENNTIATSSAGLPAGIFSLNLATSTSFGGSIIQSKTWITTGFSPNKKVISSSSGFDADCVTYQNLNLGTYYYSQLSVTGSLWIPTQYNDQNTQAVSSISDFFLYNTNSNSDGQIVLTAGNLDQTLVILQKDDHGLSCPAPQITSPLSLSATVGVPFSYMLTASSTTATVFSATSLPPGLSFSAVTNTISGTPTSSGTFNISLNAVNTCISGIDSKILVLNVAPAGTPPVTSPSSGGSSSGGHRHDIPPVVISNGLECFYLHDYMRRDFNNDPEQVMRLQAFLKAFEGYDYVTINGVFDQATFDAVSAFQMKYESDILTPWGHTAPTGYVYILTLKKINEIYCQRLFPVNESQAREIVAFKALLESLQNKGYPVQFTPEGTITLPPAGTGTSTQVELPIVGQVSPPQGQILNNLATAVFSIPVGFTNILRCLYELLLILIVLYILVNVLEDVLYKKIEDVRRKFVAKWTTICLGLFIAIVLAYIWGLWCLLLPLLIALLISLAWMFIYPVHDKIKTSVKSWYLVLSARIKSRNLPKN